MKEIPNYNGYFATKEGDIYSSKSGELKKMKTHTRKSYLRVGLSSHGKRRHKSVHRLVLETYQPIVDSCDLEVNHLNGVKDDNRLENLEWCTRSENATHAYALGLQCKKGENNGRAKMDVYKVRDIRRRFEEGESVSDMAKEYGLHSCNIRRIVNRETWKNVE